MNSANHGQWIPQKSPVSDDLHRWIYAFLLDRKSQDLAQGTFHDYVWKLKLVTDYAAKNQLKLVNQLELPRPLRLSWQRRLHQ